MPGYSGLEVCQRLKEVGETSRIPVLLTVGKLEPFKPEEAKRVRADGFIVKPFEASELLSALSKLEDKVVPRADSSKPGRFARATAAIEEGRYDKTMAIEEDDTGWKRRIAFPSKKKQEKPAEEIDDPGIYNAVNKDLRTVVTHTTVEPVPVQVMHVPASPAEEASVNVGALAPEGLPKDVTPEEIAALAAAAAQIKGKVVEEKSPAPLAEMPVTMPTESEALKVEVAQAAKPESKEAQKKEEVCAPESAPTPEVATAAPPVTFAEQQPAEKIEANSTEPRIVSQADAMTAMMGLETQMMAVHFPMPGSGTGTNGAASPTQEPVTMAVAADSAASPSRWTAVAVAVAPDEAAVSLEQEMQKAYAAFAAAEGGHAVTTSTTPEATPAVTQTIEAPVVTAEPPVAEVPASIPAIPAPEVAQPLAAVSEAATEAISAAVKELEAVAAKYEAERSATSPEPIADKSLHAAALESPSEAQDTEPKPEQKIEEKMEEKFEPKVEEKIEAKVEEQPNSELPQQTVASEATAESAVPQDQPQSEKTQDEQVAPVTETPDPVSEAERHEQESKSEEVSTEPVPVSRTSRAGGSDEMAKRETETAAAWASWRRIRETGGSKTANPAEASVKEAEESVPEDRAAMAVAAGAENKPEEVTGSFDSDPEIASIVDSVLADMRPKIVEEIARKLGKKK
jgi:CheY-like chemotaxis protein